MAFHLGCRRPTMSGPQFDAIEKKLDDHLALLKTLAGQIHKQAQQIKDLRERQDEEQSRWQETVQRASARYAKELEQLRTVQQKSDRMWQEVIDRDASRHKREMKWRATFARQVSAIARRLFLPKELPHPFGLAARRFQLRSQHEEDGILLALIEHVGPGDRRFVEIGCGRSGGNAAILAFDCGWSGLMIDASPGAIERVRQHFALNPRVISVCAAVYPETVNGILETHGYAGEVDVLSIDIDSFDYWVLDALEVCRPRILIMEYNANFGAERAVTIPYPQSLDKAPKGYHGASLAALTRLARRKGYRLVLCEYSGANAFFLRDGLAPEIPEYPVAQAFRPAMSRTDFDEERHVEDIYRIAREHDLSLVEV